MKLMSAIILAAVAYGGVVHAQSNEFQGIEGEIPQGLAAESSAAVSVSGLSFQIDRNRNRELEKATGVIPASQTQFYRPSILTAQRSRRTSGTGLTIFDKLFSLK